MTAADILLLLAIISFQRLLDFAVTMRVGANAFSFRDLGFALVVAAFLAPMLP